MQCNCSIVIHASSNATRVIDNLPISNQRSRLISAFRTLHREILQISNPLSTFRSLSLSEAPSLSRESPDSDPCEAPVLQKSNPSFLQISLASALFTSFTISSQQGSQHPMLRSRDRVSPHRSLSDIGFWDEWVTGTRARTGLPGSRSSSSQGLVVMDRRPRAEFILDFPGSQ
jgi:hypothetical protein